MCIIKTVVLVCFHMQVLHHSKVEVCVEPAVPFHQSCQMRVSNFSDQLKSDLTLEKYGLLKMKQTGPIRNIHLFLFLTPWHRKCKKRLPFRQWLKCEIPQLMVTSRLQLQVGVAAESQSHACHLDYSFHCNMTLMFAFKIVCMSPCNWPQHFPSLFCAEIWSTVR